MSEWRFKTCPRCAGDLFLNEDMRIRETYWTCLQCGYDSQSINKVYSGMLEKFKSLWMRIAPLKSKGGRYEQSTK
jgi:hypothetical protein